MKRSICRASILTRVSKLSRFRTVVVAVEVILVIMVAALLRGVDEGREPAVLVLVARVLVEAVVAEIALDPVMEIDAAPK